MIVILCTDSQNGLMFGGRRQSRDRLRLEDIQSLCGEKPLLMNEYSSRLFLSYGIHPQRIAPDFLALANSGDYCFVEGNSLLPFYDKLEKIILYRWNRVYPADLSLEPGLLDGWTLKETKEFPGSSHKIITREVYER